MDAPIIIRHYSRARELLFSSEPIAPAPVPGRTARRVRAGGAEAARAGVGGPARAMPATRGIALDAETRRDPPCAKP